MKRRVMLEPVGADGAVGVYEVDYDIVTYRYRILCNFQYPHGQVPSRRQGRFAVSCTNRD
jgi:hypothetical protein